MGTDTSGEFDFFNRKLKSEPVKKDPDFVKFRGWDSPKIRAVPSLYLMERSHRCLDSNLHDFESVLNNLADCFRILSLWVKYFNDPAGAALLSWEQVELYVCLWIVDFGQKICVEVQRRSGDSVIFHKYARHILDAASGDFDSNEYVVQNTSYLDSRYFQAAEMLMKKESVRDPVSTNSEVEIFDYILKLIEDEYLENRVIAMESLCILSDVKKASMNMAHAICRCILYRDCEYKYGKLHDFVFYVIQKRCMPDDKSMFSEYKFDEDSDEEYFDDDNRQSNLPFDYKQAMKSLVMYGFTIVGNCLEVISIFASPQVTPATTIGNQEEEMFSISRLMHIISNLTQIEFLKTLLEALGNGNAQPHNASEAARCLKFLCQLSLDVRQLATRMGVSKLADSAQTLGLAAHLRLEKESTGLLLVLGR
jgi:hypothetical protein